jgi:hypothetical protein
MWFIVTILPGMSRILAGIECMPSLVKARDMPAVGRGRAAFARLPSCCRYITCHMQYCSAQWQFSLA